MRYLCSMILDTVDIKLAGKKAASSAAAGAGASEPAAAQPCAC